MGSQRHPGAHRARRPRYQPQPGRTVSDCRLDASAARPHPDGRTPTACSGGGDRPRTGRGQQAKGWWLMAYRKLTEAERAERREADRDRLEQAARALLSSDGWQRWVRVRSTNGLSRYSFHNQLLIAMQCPDASYVAGFRAFLQLNRCVRKGERAIRILAPMRVRTRNNSTGRGGGEDGEQPRRTVFRAVPVFDVSQTEGLPGTEPVSLDSPSQPIQGDTHAHLLTPLQRLAGEVGYSVNRRA